MHKSATQVVDKAAVSGRKPQAVIDVSERLTAVRKTLKLTQKELSDLLGIALRTYIGHEHGLSFPKGETLRAIASLGIDLNWLLTGNGSMRPATVPVEAQSQAQTMAPAASDHELYGLILEGLDRLYKSENQRITMRAQGAQAAEIHDELIAVYADPAERRVALRLRLEQLRQELRRPDENPLRVNADP